MRRHIVTVFNNLPIGRKLLLTSAIPLVALLFLSIGTYHSVQKVSQDEEQLNRLYVAQKSAAQYMRLVVDLETGFRGYVMTEQTRYLRPYRVAEEGVAAIGKELEGSISGDQLTEFKAVQALVPQLIREKGELIQAIKAGHKQEAVHYIEEGRGRALMVEIRERMARFDQLEQQRVAEELTQLSQDRSVNLFVILGGGVVTLMLIVGVLYLIARSIAAPLHNLAAAVGSSPAGQVPAIPTLARRDEIGELTRVMHAMGTQIQGHVEQVEKSEAALRIANQDLMRSESKYRGLVDHAPFGIFTTMGTEVTFSNRYNQSLAGLDPDETVDPSTFRQWIHPEDQGRVLSEFAAAVAEGRPYETVFHFVHKDGSVRKVLSRRLLVNDKADGARTYVGFNIDITALDDLQSRLNRAEHLATLGQVAAGIAHELRNPLVGIGSTAALLMDDLPAGDPRRADIDMILREARRLDRIVNQIVEYARPRELAPVRFNVSDVVGEVVKTFDAQLQGKRLAIQVSVPPTLGFLHADRDQIKQVVLNVVHNAIDATPADGGTIEVSVSERARQDRPGFVIEVKDVGAGISSAALVRVFEPFFTTGKRHGTGLGLAICRNIVEEHGGDIHMTSEVGKGTTVRIWLPSNQECHLVKG